MGSIFSPARHGRRLSKPLLSLGVGAMGTLAGVVALGLYGAHQVGRPRRQAVDFSSAEWGLTPERMRFQSRDGIGLAALLMRSPTSRATVILVHGHGTSKEAALPVAAMLYPAFHVLALDVRGHGESDGSFTSVGYLERLDVIAAADWIAAELGGPIGVAGVSMGAAAAILAAAEHPALAAIVADSGFTTLREVVATAAWRRGYPRPLTPLLAELTCRTLALQQGYPVTAPDPIRAIGRITPRPLLVMHGATDSLCPVEHANRLYAAAGEPKSLWIAPEMEHATAHEHLAEEYGSRIREFFQRWLIDPRDASRDAQAGRSRPVASSPPATPAIIATRSSTTIPPRSSDSSPSGPERRTIS